MHLPRYQPETDAMRTCFKLAEASRAARGTTEQLVITLAITQQLGSLCSLIHNVSYSAWDLCT